MCVEMRGEEDEVTWRGEEGIKDVMDEEAGVERAVIWREGDVEGGGGRVQNR